jgi:hypothetical protein
MVLDLLAVAIRLILIMLANEAQCK